MTKVLHIVNFDSGSARLTRSEKSGVKRAVAGATDRPTIIFDAYADPSGSDGLNLALTTARATIVREYVMSLGYPPHKLLIRARGHRSFERADLPAQSPLSRRVEIIAV